RSNGAAALQEVARRERAGRPTHAGDPARVGRARNQDGPVAPEPLPVQAGGGVSRRLRTATKRVTNGRRRPMALTSADFLLQRLHENGVRRIYGYPGDGINAIVGALGGQRDKLDFLQVRHEEMAAFMACAHAKWTGEVGVCLATSGPGAIHLLNGL